MKVGSISVHGTGGLRKDATGVDCWRLIDGGGRGLGIKISFYTLTDLYTYVILPFHTLLGPRQRFINAHFLRSVSG